MIEFTIYKKSGEILSSGVCQNDLLQAQVAHDKNLFVLPTKADYKTQFIEDGKVKNLPNRLSEHHFFNYQKKDWEFNSEHAWKRIKEERGTLMLQTDWVVIKAQETGTPVPVVWLNYRQALRDITLQTDPLKIVWPVSP